MLLSKNREFLKGVPLHSLKQVLSINSQFPLDPLKLFAPRQTVCRLLRKLLTGFPKNHQGVQGADNLSYSPLQQKTYFDFVEEIADQSRDLEASLFVLFPQILDSWHDKHSPQNPYHPYKHTLSINALPCSYSLT